MIGYNAAITVAVDTFNRSIHRRTGTFELSTCDKPSMVCVTFAWAKSGSYDSCYRVRLTGSV